MNAITITPGVLLGLSSGGRRFIDQGDVVFDQAWTNRANITTYTELATAQPGVTPVAIATTFSGPPTGDELEYEDAGGLRGILITFRGNANDGSIANFQLLLASTGEYFRQLTSGAQFQRVGKGVTFSWAERGNNDLIPLSKLPTLGLSHSELDITYDFGQSLFSNVHELVGEPDDTATGKTHIGNAIQDLRFRTVGGVEILAGEGYIEFRARVVQEDGTTYTDPLPRRFTLTGLEKDRRYLAEELQSHHGTTEVDIDFAIQLRDNVNGAGEIIPGVRITLTATQTNQDNQPVFGILLLEYARPIANVDVDERIRQEVSVWAHTDDERPIPAEKLVTAHKAIPIPGNPTAADLNDIGPGIFLFTNSLPVLGIPIGTWLLVSNQTEDASVDLYQEAKRLDSSDSVIYARKKITGTWVDGDVFAEVESGGGGEGGLNELQVDNRIATWARASNQDGTADIPDGAISDNIARSADVQDIEVWAEVGNTDQIPANKLENASGITPEQAQAITDNTAKFSAETWAREGNTDIIPSNKLPASNGGGLDQSEVDARVAAGVADWAEEGNTDEIPPSKTNTVAWALNNNPDQIPLNKLGNVPARGLNQEEVDARTVTGGSISGTTLTLTKTGAPAVTITGLPSGSGGGLDEAAVDARVEAGVEDWAETGNTDRIPETKISEDLARISQVDTAIEESVEDWARDDTTVIPANKIPEAHINFEESQFTTYVVGQINDAIYRVNPITQEFIRIGNVQGFSVNEFNPTGIANINGTVYVTGERRKLIRLDVDENNELTGAGTQLSADNTLPEGIRSMTDRLGELIAAVDDPHSTAVSLIDIDKATGLASNSRALTGTTQIADITTSPTGEIHACCPIGTVWNLCLINPAGGAVIPVGPFTSNGANVTINTLWWEGTTLKGISNEIGDDDIFVIDPSTGAMRELAMTNAFGVGEFLPQGAVAVPHYQTLPVAVSWARQGNTDIIPVDKLPAGGGGLDQDAVDGRVRAIVDDWAESGNDDPIPADKLSNAGSAAFVATRIQGTGSAINGFSVGRASFLLSGNPVLGLPAGEYLLVATESNLNGVHLNQEATNATTNQKFIRHNTDGIWTSSDMFVEFAGGSGGGGSPLVIEDNYVHIGTPNLSSETETGVVSGADSIRPSTTSTLQRYNVRFDNTLPNYNIPSAGTYNPANGDMILPPGHWIICASLNIQVTGATNSRVQADLSINHGTNQRHSQAVYLRGDGSYFGSAGINDSQGKVSVTGAVVSDGITPIRVRVAVARQSSPTNIRIRGAHVHGYRQLISGNGVDVEDWAEAGNTDPIPEAKIISDVITPGTTESLYLLGAGTNANLYRLENSQLIQVGNQPGAFGLPTPYFGGLTEHNGQLWMQAGLGNDTDGSVIYTINPNTAEVTEVGPTGVPDISGTLVSHNGTLFLFVRDVLHSINTETGAATRLVTLSGFPTSSNQLRGSASLGGTLYLSQSSSGSNRIYSVNTNTGAVTSVGNIVLTGNTSDYIEGMTAFDGRLFATVRRISSSINR